MYYDKNVIELILKYKKKVENYEELKKSIFDIFKSNEYLLIDKLIDYEIFKEILIEYSKELNNYNLIKYIFIDRYLHYSYLEEGFLFDLYSSKLYDSNIIKMVKDNDNNVLMILEYK